VLLDRPSPLGEIAASGDEGMASISRMEERQNWAQERALRMKKPVRNVWEAGGVVSPSWAGGVVKRLDGEKPIWSEIERDSSFLVLLVVWKDEMERRKKMNGSGEGHCGRTCLLPLIRKVEGIPRSSG
jgi:hypothetical protein